jgi:hypothetical protein
MHLKLSPMGIGGWDLFLVLGIPLGSFISASRSGSFSWSSLSGPAMWKLAGRGVLLGASGSLAGGCTVGHGLAGIPLLSLGSIVFTIFAMIGVWFGLFLEKHFKVSQKPK